VNTVLPGINGALFPSRYLADCLGREATGPGADESLRRKQTQLTAWWTRVATSSGPATGLRALFDMVAMPLFGVLGFRASEVLFDRTSARARLTTRRQAAVGLLVVPWASRPSTIWRGAVSVARELGASWCFVLAPPFLSLVAARGSALRRSVDFALPDALDLRSLSVLLTLAGADAFDRPEGSAAARIESLVVTATLFQDRVRTDLQDGVAEALALLSEVLPASKARPTEPFDEALTLVYRILFLLFAESRDLVPRDHPIYRGAYAIGGLCREAQRPELSTDLWDGLAAVTRLSRVGCEIDDLIVRPFNGHLFARRAAPSLEQRATSRRHSRATAARDAAMRKTLVALATRLSPAGREEICYADLGVEQLGAVYERVLDIEPAQFPSSARSIGLRPRTAGRHSQRRKESGTFYTPQDLAEFVVRRTLAPLVAGQSANAILALRVVDPAMGSGAFLVAACRYLAAAYERALVDEGECSEADLDDDARGNIRRLVAERCLAGVDVNPVAVQLARLSLWLATLAHGKPLGFLDHRLRVGNSLIGASPDDLRRVGDRRKAAKPASLPLLADVELERSLCQITSRLVDLSSRRDDTIDDVRAKETIWTTLTGDRSPVAKWRLAATLWCARWFWPASAAVDEPAGPFPSGAGMRAAIDAILRNDRTLGASQLAQWLAVARSLDATHRFFHWPLEFADVFYDQVGRPRSRPGFDAVIGNPPWEMLRKEPNARRVEFRSPGASDQNRRVIRFIRESGLYPSCDRGHVNLYQPFLERALEIARPGGRVGLVLPWGLAVDDGAAALRARLFDQATTDTIVGLDNAAGLFPIHRGLRFLVVVASPGGLTREFRARFGVRTNEEIASLADADDGGRDGGLSYPVRLSPGLVATVGGPARRIPDVRHPDHLVFAERLAQSHPKLGAANGWNARFGRELNATGDRASFGTRGLPVIEGKHIQPFAVDVRSSSFRIERAMATERLPAEGFSRPRLAYRDVSGVANRFSLIAAVVPADVVTTHTLFCLRTSQPIERHHFLCGIFNSYVLNALVRMLMGGHLTTSLVENLPVPVWTGTPAQRRIARLARRQSGRPHARTCALLQAAVARQYGIEVETFRRLLAGFPLVPSAERDLALNILAARPTPTEGPRNTESSRS
jgi:hypothetical protein